MENTSWNLLPDKTPFRESAFDVLVFGTATPPAVRSVVGSSQKVDNKQELETTRKFQREAADTDCLHHQSTAWSTTKAHGSGLPPSDLQTSAPLPPQDAGQVNIHGIEKKLVNMTEGFTPDLLTFSPEPNQPRKASVGISLREHEGISTPMKHQSHDEFIGFKGQDFKGVPADTLAANRILPVSVKLENRKELVSPSMPCIQLSGRDQGKPKLDQRGPCTDCHKAREERAPDDDAIDVKHDPAQDVLVHKAPGNVVVAGKPSAEALVHILPPGDTDEVKRNLEEDFQAIEEPRPEVSMSRWLEPDRKVDPKSASAGRERDEEDPGTEEVVNAIQPDGGEELNSSTPKDGCRRPEPSRETALLDTSLCGFGTFWKKGKRRSRRIRIRPLQYWMNEHAVYSRRHKGLPTVEFVQLYEEKPAWPAIDEEKIGDTIYIRSKSAAFLLSKSA